MASHGFCLQVWRNLLARVAIPVSQDIDFHKLGQHQINGREIKNAVRLAASLAREMETDVTQAVLDTTMNVTMLGRHDMRTDDSWREVSCI
jgi:hypothetical protein